MIKNTKLFKTLLFSSFLLGSFLPIKVKAETIDNYVISTNGCSQKAVSVVNKLDLNLVSEEDIREYYSSLNALDDSQKSGISVLKYLKPILSNMNYYTYSSIGNIYSITDRDWTNSPNISSGEYDALTNTVSNFKLSEEADTNPYIRMLYVDYSDDYKTPLRNSKGTANFDKEHVWCQSRGFKDSDGASGPAGTDLHHLISADSYVNESIHNNNPYGFVDNVDGVGNTTYTSNNKKGSILHTSSKDESNIVFEPSDEYKGDIARAIFYMMARYNNISNTETITEFDPNLEIVNYATSNGTAITSTNTKSATMGILSDLLAWNKLDPVSEFEIYRNDLIYRNFQGNRNPFIDFPQWIDAIWGTADIDGSNYNSLITTKIDPINDSINDSNASLLKVSSNTLKINKGNTLSVSANNSSTTSITWTILDSSIASINKTTSLANEEIIVSGLKVGRTTLKVSTIIDEEEVERSIIVIVKDNNSNEEEDEFDYLYMIAISIGCLLLSTLIYSYNKKNKKKYNSKKYKKKK